MFVIGPLIQRSFLVVAFLFCGSGLLLVQEINAFVIKNTPIRIHPRNGSSSVVSSSSTTKLNNFFKNILDQAFENDSNLSKDRSEGQLDAAEYDDDDDQNNVASRYGLTSVQRQWRDGKAGTKAVTSTILQNNKWNVDFFLTGIPNKDPSNDLFAGRTNISTRDRKVGLSIPETPTVADRTLEFLENGVCRYVANAANDDDDDFVAGDGEWRLSDDGTMVRFSLLVVGYTRTVVTKGSIQKIYWSDEDDITRQTTTEYSIPQGYVYCDARIGTRKNNVALLDWNDAVVRVEQPTGLLGAGTKMVPCGTFRVRNAPSEL